MLVLFVPYRNEDTLVWPGETPETAFLRARQTHLLQGVPQHRLAELTAAYQRAQLVQRVNPEHGRPIFSAIRSQIFDDEDPGNNFQRLYDDLQEEHSDSEYEDVDIDSFLQPVPQFDVHLHAVSALKQEQKAFFDEIPHVLAEQARQQETSQLLAFYHRGSWYWKILFT